MQQAKILVSDSEHEFSPCAKMLFAKGHDFSRAAR